MKMLQWMISVFLVGLILTGCEPKPEETELDPLFFSDQVEIAWDVMLEYSDSLTIKAKVEGHKLVRYTNTEDEREEFPEGVKVTFYDKEGQPTSDLVADFGVRHGRKSQIRGIGNVIFKHQTGEKLETEELIWDEEKGLIYTQKFVMITTEDEKIWGMGFESNPDFTRRKINTPQGRINIEATSE
jgi:LPS export ABC transporter protein LptC